MGSPWGRDGVLASWCRRPVMPIVTCDTAVLRLIRRALDGYQVGIRWASGGYQVSIRYVSGMYQICIRSVSGLDQAWVNRRISDMGLW